MHRQSHLLTTSVIGLGAMGSGMALNLHRHAALATAWNRSRERVVDWASSANIPLAPELSAAVEQAELILTCVSRDEDLLEVIDRITPALTADQVVLDTSTVSVESAREAARRVASRGAEFIDGPVSGGREGAQQGTLVMMAGGESATLDRLRPTLASITRTVTHMGPVGAGQATKAVNQLMAAGINQAVTEALAFGQSQGLDMSQVIEVISGGAAGNWFLEHRGNSMLEGRFEPGFKLALHHKDLEICRRMAEVQGVNSLLLEMTLADYQTLLDEGRGDEDISSLFRLKHRLYE
ncbi:MAG: NAD(P)-dependent oxidoreductase [Gammaproteobacteria bacterium]|nr:NAD(P)-dependent oxidoreductase [Gammaproteobacteria bacterium]